MSKRQRHIFFILLACVLLGFILSRQFYWHKRLQKTTEPEQEKELALQVSQLIKSNADLRRQLTDLSQQNETLQKAAYDRRAARESLETSLRQYELILATVPVKGEGITLQLEQQLDTTQITDLINALRNIGAEAIAINGRRIAPSTGWDNRTLSSPYTIQVIGDSDLLKDSLERRGGIMEQLGQAGTIKKEDELNLPSAK